MEVRSLEELMGTESIQLFPPINLVEGFAAFPFVFSLRNDEGEKLGYIATVLNVKYLLNRIHLNDNADNFIYQFKVNDTIHFDREVVHDLSEAYNTNEDKFCYHNFAIRDDDFLFETIHFFNIKITVGVAHKNGFIENKNLMILAYLWYFILIGFSVFIVYQTYKIVQINSKLVAARESLEIKNKELNKRVEQVRTLIKEVHHRVKNNLQIIGSLINLQSYKEKNPTTLKALIKTKNRIEAMSLVHKKLYGHDTLSTVKIKSYIEQLMETIRKTIGFEDKEVELKIITNKNIELSMDIMTPLGLILNELISNSFKYAFNEKGNNNWVSVEVKQNDDKIDVFYTDSGPGLSEEIDISNSETLGFELMHLLAEQLTGEFHYYSTTNSFQLTFKK